MSENTINLSLPKESFLSVRRNRILLILLLCAVSFVIHCWNIQDLQSIYVTSDEMGYWGTASYLASTDWSPIISNIYYYSYGYSLLLAPLFHLFPDPAMMYQAAIVLNGIMMAAVIPIAYQIGKQVFPHSNQLFLLLSSFCASLYPAYILQSSINRNECLLIFLFWIMLYLVLQLHQKAPLWKFCLFAILGVYAYMIHQRSLGIVIAACILMLVLLIGKRISWKQFIVFCIAFCLMLLLHSVLKSYIQNSIWLNSDTSSANDFGSVSNRFDILFSFSGFSSFLRTLMGQIFYLGTASFLFAYLGFVYLVPTSIRVLRTSFKRKSRIVENETLSSNHVLLFLLLCVIFTVVISALFMIRPNRIDHVLYGRYNEFVTVPLILFALLSLSQCKQRKKLLIISCICCIIYALFGVASYYSVQSLTNFSTISSPGIAWAERFLNQQWYVLILVPLICFIILSSLLYPKSSPKIHWTKYIAILLCTAAFIIIGRYPVTHTVLPAQQSIEQVVSSPKEYLKQNEISTLYYYWDNSPESGYQYWDIAYIQFAIPDLKIYPIHTMKDWAALPDGTKIIALTKDLLNKDLLDLVAIDLISNRFILGTVDHSNTKKPTELQLPLSLFATQNGTFSEGFISITSNGQEGFLLYGPYISFPAGKYTASFDVSGSKSVDLSSTIGYIDVMENGNELTKRKISTSDIDQNGRTTFDISFDLQNSINGLELRLFTSKASVVTVHHITIAMHLLT